MFCPNLRCGCCANLASITVDLKASQAIIPASTVCVTHTGGFSYTYFRYQVPESSKSPHHLRLGNFALFERSGSQLALNGAVCDSAPCVAASTIYEDWIPTRAIGRDTSTLGIAWCSAGGKGYGWFEYRFDLVR